MSWESVSEVLLSSAFLTCGIFNSIDGTEDVLNRNSILRKLNAEEVGSDVENPFQYLDDNADGIDSFSNTEG